MGSERYFGKSMHIFKSKPLLSYLIDSLMQCFDKNIIYVATSELKENNVIRMYCSENNINVYSGEEINVASRFLKILEQIRPEFFIRINGDSPLLDYRVIENSLIDFDNDLDLLSTIYKNRFPSGMNFEIVNTNTFIDEYINFQTESHYEHVTKFFYENEKRFKIRQVNNPIKNSNQYKFSFDNETDKERIVRILNYMEYPHYFYTLEEKCRIYNELFGRL